MDAVDRFIDWDMAREQLIELQAEVIEALKVCDTVLLLSEPDSISSKYLDIERLFETCELDEEGIYHLSAAYMDALKSIRMAVSFLGKGEVHEPPPSTP